MEADDYGIELAAKAGYDPWGLVRALEKMKAAGHTTSPNGFNSIRPQTVVCNTFAKRPRNLPQQRRNKIPISCEP